RQHERGGDVVGESDDAAEAGAEQTGPAVEPVEVFERRPVLPGLAGLLRRAAGVTATLHVHDQLRILRPDDNEVERLNLLVAEQRPLRLVDGDERYPPAAEVGLERRLVVVVPLHRFFAWVSV